MPLTPTDWGAAADLGVRTNGSDASLRGAEPDTHESRQMTARPFERHAPVKATSGDRSADAADVDMRLDHPAVRVLSVEDLNDNQEIITRILRGAGHRVDCAANGNEAITLLDLNEYDLILMDIQMPVMGGIEATQLIRHADHPRHDIPILAMTGNTQPDRVEQLSAAGITDVISKPFRKAYLLKKIALWTTPDDVGTALPAAREDMMPPDFNQDDFDEFLSLMGPDTALRWINTLHTQLLPSVLGAMDDLIERPEIVHDIVAKAGMLGFRGLSASCARLEQQILGNRALDEFATTQREARRVNDALPRMRQMMNALR